MGVSSRWWMVCAWVSVAACAPEPEPVAPWPTVRLLDPELMLRELQGQLHLRVFPKGDMQCDGYNTSSGDPNVGRYVVRSGQRVLDALPGGGVTPMVRCAQGATGLRASPVDTCVTTMTQRLEVAAGTYIVLVHGQGDIPLPNGMTQSGIRGSGCAVVTVGAGDQRSVTIPIHGVRPAGVCGNGVVDFDETCDAPNDANCVMCQTREAVANRVVVGNERQPAVVWGPSQRLVVGYAVTDVDTTTGEDVYAQFFLPDGSPETSGGLANDQRLGTGPNPQQRPVFATTGGAAGTRFVAAWETFEQNASQQSVAAQSYSDGPPGTARVHVGAAGTRRQRPSIAASANRVVVVWSETGGIRTSSAPLALPLAGDLASPASVYDGAGEDPKIAALPDGSFVVVWASSGDLWARRLAATGAPMGMATALAMAGTQDQPALAALPDGSVALAWRDASMTGQARATIRWARIAAGTLAVMGTGTVLSTTTATSEPSRPALAVGAVPTGASGPAILFVWEDAATGRIHGRLRGADNAELASRISGATADFAISAEGGTARHDPVAAFSGGDAKRFAVAWQGVDSMGDGIVMRQFPQ